jgi:hypothetical protein
MSMRAVRRGSRTSVVGDQATAGDDLQNPWSVTIQIILSRRDSGTTVELTIPAALAYAESPVATRPRSLGKGT